MKASSALSCSALLLLSCVSHTVVSAEVTPNTIVPERGLDSLQSQILRSDAHKVPAAALSPDVGDEDTGDEAGLENPKIAQNSETLVPPETVLDAEGVECSRPNVPSRVMLEGSWGTSYNVVGVNNNITYGVVSSDAWSLASELTWTWNGVVQSKGSQEFWSFGENLEITDCHGNTLAKVEEDLVAGFIRQFKYLIQDKDGDRIGLSDHFAHQESYGRSSSTIHRHTDWSIYSADGARALVHFTRPWSIFNGDYDWTVHTTAPANSPHPVLDTEMTDPRITVMIAALQSADSSASKTWGWILLISGAVCAFLFGVTWGLLTWKEGCKCSGISLCFGMSAGISAIIAIIGAILLCTL